MGNTESSDGSATDSEIKEIVTGANELYERIENGGVSGAAECATLPRIGGCGCAMLGGLDAMDKYNNSVYSREKEELIQKLAKEVGPLFNLKGLEKKSPAEIHKEFKKHIPANWTVAAKHQNISCEKLAAGINNVYGRELISRHLAP